MGDPYSRRQKMNTNLEHYRIFYYTGKYGSITQAAEELSISQPAVSQALKQLEHTLGTALFIRTAKGVRFTAEGEMLYSYVARGYEYIQNGEEKLMQMLNLSTGEIRIGASDMSLQYYLLPYLEQFHEKYPKIKITVSNATTPETLVNLQEGKIDFGLVTAPFHMRKDLRIQEVRKLQDIFVAGSRFAHLQRKKLSYEELLSLPLILLEDNTSTRRYTDEFLREQGVVIRPEFELATSDMLVQFARKNLGIACVVSDFAQEYVDSGELFELEFDRRIPQRSMYMIVDRHNPVSLAAKNLLQMLHVKLI